MNFNLKKPCKDCPFRTDIRPFLTRSRAEDIASSLLELDQSFPCHKTVDYEDDGEGFVGPSAEHCAGALIMLEHMEQPNQMMRIAERLGLYDRTKLDMEAPVYSNEIDFIENQNR